MPPGCRFAERCPFATDLCRSEEPELSSVGEGHAAACHYIARAEEFRERARLYETWQAGAVAT